MLNDFSSNHFKKALVSQIELFYNIYKDLDISYVIDPTNKSVKTKFLTVVFDLVKTMILLGANTGQSSKDFMSAYLDSHSKNWLLIPM